MDQEENKKSNYPGCPPGWEPPLAPIMEHSTAVVAINAYLIEQIMPEIAEYIDAEYTSGTVFDAVQAFFSAEMPKIRDDEDLKEQQWMLKGKKGSFWIDMDLDEGYFFCSISVLRAEYFVAKALLEKLRDRVHK